MIDGWRIVDRYSNGEPMTYAKDGYELRVTHANGYWMMVSPRGMWERSPRGNVRRFKTPEAAARAIERESAF